MNIPYIECLGKLQFCHVVSFVDDSYQQQSDSLTWIFGPVKGTHRD